MAEFEGAAPTLLGAVTTRRQLGVSIGFDGDKVARQLRVVAEASAILGQVRDIEQRLSDILSVQRSDAWLSCLEIYGVAKIAERRDPGLRAVILPMAGIFRNRAPARLRVPRAKAGEAAVEEVTTEE